MIRHISLVYGLVPRLFANSYCFCAAGKDRQNPIVPPRALLTDIQSLSESAQMALLASTAIKTILKAPNQQNLQSQSLRQSLLDLKLDESVKHLLTPQVASEFKMMFGRGIPIKHPLLQQKRIRQGSIGDKFTFFPNLLTTKQIFSALSQKKNYLILGSYGTGKTTSMILYCLLSNLINKFRFQSWSQSQPLRQIYQRQADALEGLINTNVKRNWYWTFHKDLYQSDNLKQIMLKQAYELSQQTKERIKKIQPYKEFIRQLRSLYPPDLRHCHIIDHINSCASVVRKLNEEGRQKLQEVKELQGYALNNPLFAHRYKVAENQHQKIIKAMKQLKSKTLDFLNYTKQADQKGNDNNQFILDSSMNIQKDILYQDKNPEFLKPTVALGIKHQKYSLSFKDNLRQAWGNIDFMHFFFHQIRKRIQQGLQPDSMNLIYSLFKEVCKEEKFQAKSYYRFLFINQYFNTTKLASGYLEQLKKNPHKGRVKQIFKHMLEDFPSKCILLFQDKLENFRQKGGSETKVSKQILIDILYLAAKQRRESNKMNMEFDISFFKQLMPTKGTFQQIFFTVEHNQQLFPVSIDNCNRDTINLQWDPQDCVNILESSISPDFKAYLKSLTGKTKKSHIGGYFQQQTIEALQIGTVATFRIFRLNRLNSLFFVKTSRKFEIVSCSLFTHFLTKKKSLSINMKDLIQAANERPSEFVFATPSTTGSQQSDNSPTIDFVMAKYDESTESYTIYTFDLTTTKSTLAKKIKNAKNLFNQIIKSQQDNKLKYKIIHVIVAYNQLLKTQLLKNKGITSHQDHSFQIVLSDIQGMSFSSKPKEMSHVIFLWDLWRRAVVNYDNIFSKSLQKKERNSKKSI